jgi:hypothetical protein
MRSTVNPSDHTVTRVGDVDEIGVSSNATRISKQGLLTGGIYPSFRARADDVLYLPEEVKNHHAMMVGVRDEYSPTLVVDNELAGTRQDSTFGHLPYLPEAVFVSAPNESCSSGVTAPFRFVPVRTSSTRCPFGERPR